VGGDPVNAASAAVGRVVGAKCAISTVSQDGIPLSALFSQGMSTQVGAILRIVGPEELAANRAVPRVGDFPLMWTVSEEPMFRPILQAPMNSRLVDQRTESGIYSVNTDFRHQ
jgi:hypothetical protein